MTVSKINSLSITGGKGLGLTFDNGYTLSVQIGGGNYCDNYNEDIYPVNPKLPPSTTAEMAIVDQGGDLIAWPGSGGDTVSNRTPVSEIPKWIEYVSSL